MSRLNDGRCNGKHQATFAQPAGLKMRSVDAGLVASLLVGRIGLATKLPPQLGHFSRSTVATQVAQKVHSNEQIRASVDSGGSALSQHSQDGRSCNISFSLSIAANVILCRLLTPSSAAAPNTTFSDARANAWPHPLGVILLAKDCITIFPSRTTNVSVPNS